MVRWSKKSDNRIDWTVKKIMYVSINGYLSIIEHMCVKRKIFAKYLF